MSPEGRIRQKEEQKSPSERRGFSGIHLHIKKILLKSARFMKKQLDTFFSSISKLLSPIPSLLLLFTFVLYVFGFFCENSYLSSFGFLPLEILKTRYLIAGAYCLIFIAILLFINFYHLVTWSKIFNNKKIKNKIYKFSIYLLLLVLLLIGVSTGIYVAFSMVDSGAPKVINSIYSIKLNKYWYLALIMFLIDLFFPLLFLLISKIKKSNKFKLGKTVLDYSFFKMFISLFSFSLALFIFIVLNFNSKIFNVTSLNLNNQYLNTNAILTWLYLNSFNMLILIFPFYGPFLKKEINLEFILDHNYSFFILFAWLFSVMMSFGKNIYPKISGNIGGGRPSKVIIQEYEKYNINASREYFLIDKSANNYLMVADIGGTRFPIEIAKDKVETLIYLNEK